MITSMNNMVREFGAQLIGLLNQYNMILEEMIKLRVFTDNAVTLLKEQMDKTGFELKNDPCVGYDSLNTVSQHLTRSGEKYSIRLNERINHEISNGMSKESLTTVFSTRDELVIVLKRTRQLNSTLLALQKWNETAKQWIVSL